MSDLRNNEAQRIHGEVRECELNLDLQDFAARGAEGRTLRGDSSRDNVLILEGLEYSNEGTCLQLHHRLETQDIGIATVHGLALLS